MKKIILILFLFCSSFANAQIFINREYQEGSGSPTFNVLNPLGLQWSKSITCVNGDLVMVGHTYAGTDGEDIYVIRRGAGGSIIFSQHYDVAGAHYNDYGTDIYEAANNDFIICGTTDNGTITDYDVVVLRINSGGTLLTYTTRNGPSHKNDFAVSIVEDGFGYIYVAANTENSFFDYWVIKWDSGLTFTTENFYDYAGLSDVAIGMEFDSGSSEMRLIGASASGTNSCDYAIARFDATSLSYLGDGRSSLPGVALDQALAYCRDGSNNTYITGKAWNGTNYDIKTVKINSNMTVAWTATMDVHSYDDAGTTIALDTSNGHVIVGGYATRSGNIKDMICIRYNGSSGAAISSPYTQSSENASGDAFIKKIDVNSTGEVYFVGEEKGNSGAKQVVVGKISTSVFPIWQKRIADANDDILPSDIEVASDGIYVISVLDSTIDSYLTTKYSEMQLDTSKIYRGGTACWKKNELIVSFMPDVINKAAIDNHVGTAITEFGNLSEFLTSSANTAVNTAFGDILRDGVINAVKIYTGLKTTDTVAVSRLGQNVAVPSFWSTLLLQFPSFITLQQAGDALSSLPNVVSYSHPNCFAQTLTSPPNDSLYSLQLSLHGSNFTNINVETAWDVVQSCGGSFVKGGIFDSGVEWKHMDFGYTGSPTSGKMRGWYFPLTNSSYGNMDIRNNNTPGYPNDAFGHGTYNAGIIGAERNNISGVAGIAGGDGSNNNPGVSLYSLNTANTPIINSLNAVFETTLNDTSQAHPYRYGLNFSNNSYKLSYATLYPDSFAAFRDVLRFANRMQVTFIAARGNDSANSAVYPANFDTSWVISVGGLGSTPAKWSGSSYGSKMDLIAPAIGSFMNSTGITGPSSYGHPSGNGTSLAAPHVSGVVALLMSYMNDSTGQNTYMNLAPEDCEYILQRTTQDLAPLGYDSLLVMEF